uniref:Propionyl-CoA carboxylase alpha chain, mitochondrial n=1 Tax=Parastrongyloides trichosuri TaxID=131310 RepID=A0A0N4Z0L0_PARTI
MHIINITSTISRCSARFAQLRSLSLTQTIHCSNYNFGEYDTKTYTIDKINPSEGKFNKILIANRGEIACRVMKTCKAMGIKTVAVHSDVDSTALHVRMADEAVCIGSAPTSESYLRADRILDAVKQTGAEAVHPGYGFLSENTVFAAQLADNGVKFIGPNSKAILDMGDKIHSKKIATEAKVNMIPGFDGEIVDEEHCVKISNQIGYPVMIKASAGGGGKGMRVAWNDEECVRGYRLSKQEAKSSFGDDRMLVEKFIDNPRHIEVQVLCDQHGNGIYLNERECSIQRRNQKVIEEAPSSFVDPEMRIRMGEQAVQLAKAVGYDSAGTVEFLVDSKKNFYFLEMNTRLQVEHPITEQITHVDIVQQMLRVAYGHKLNIKQSDIGIHGWSFESRVYAEDPYKGFGLPSVGRLTKYEEPSHKIQGIRCDSGIREGSEISIYYDPLICKLVSYGKDRNEALDRMREALDNYVIRGVTHNISLHRDIIDEENFRKGNITTKYLEQTYPDGFKGTQLNEKEESHLIALSGALYAKKDARAQKFKNYAVPKEPFNQTYKYVLQTGEKGEENFKQFDVTINFVNGDTNNIKAYVDGKKIELKGDTDLSQSVLRIKAGDELMTTQIHSKKAGSITLIYKGSPFKMSVYPAVASEYLKYMKERPKLDLSSVVLSPMPGAIKNVSVKEGDMVSEGQELVIIEAMKMQNSLLAGKTGKVKKVNCKVGSTVDEGEILVELE